MNKMAETESAEPDHPRPPEKHQFSIRIWPPSQRTRESVIDHLLQTLSSPSTFTNRYGIIPTEDAAAAAKNIEEESFSAAASCCDASEEDAERGIERIQAYSKEISKRVLEMVKAKASERPDGAALPSEQLSSQ